jgi:hypothetical protein
MLYTAVVTRIVGNQQTTIELPCRNIEEFSRTTEFFNRAAILLGSPKPFQTVISHCPYGMIASARGAVRGKSTGEYVFATLHRNEPAS